MEERKENIIKISNVERDTQIGKVFNELFSIIYRTEKYKDNIVKWDFIDSSFFHPFFLAPLSIYKHSKRNIECINIDKTKSYVQRYFNLICFNKIFYIDNTQDLKLKLNNYLNKKYIPICCFDINQNNIDSIQSIIQKVIEKQYNGDLHITTPLAYMFGELITNIKEHSHCTHGYIFSQYLTRERCLNICISDDGITILGSYQKAQKFTDKIHNNPAEALRLANEGVSTKGTNNERGFGISTTRKMLVNGLNGSFFMMSGNAFFRSVKQMPDEVKELPKELTWNGTIILIKIPLDIPKDFNYTDFLE